MKPLIPILCLGLSVLTSSAIPVPDASVVAVEGEDHKVAFKNTQDPHYVSAEGALEIIPPIEDLTPEGTEVRLQQRKAAILDGQAPRHII